MQEPGQGHVGGVLAQVLAERLVALQLGPELLDLGLDALGGAAAGLGLGQRPAEQAAAQGAPGYHAEAILARRRQHLELDRTLGQVVEALLRDQAQEVPAPGLLVGLGDVPAREVRAAHVEHLALFDELLHGLPDFFPGRLAPDVVHLVEVDVVEPHALQAALAGALDVQRRELRGVGPLAHVAVDLGGDDDLLAPAAALGEPAAEDLLGDALAAHPAVDVGRVEEVDAVLERAVHDGERVRFGGLGPEVHRAQAQPADHQAGAAEVGVFHGGLLSREGEAVLYAMGPERSHPATGHVTRLNARRTVSRSR
ncbi:hypothetical protein D3C72_1228730 [compost metagenome]